MASEQSPLLRLPAEIRLIIWEMLFIPEQGISAARANSRAVHFDDNHTKCDKPWTIHIHTIEPDDHGPPSTVRRSTYLVRAARFRSRTMRTTYALTLPSCADQDSFDALYPFTSSMALLQTCKRLHAEVSSLLYSSYTFSFGYNIEAIAPFLADRTPLARSHIHHLALSKRAAPYAKNSDTSEWAAAMAYLSDPSSHLKLASLDLAVQALSPGEDTPGSVAGSPSADMPAVDSAWFRVASGMGVFDTADDGLGWAVQMHAVRGLQSLRVRSVVERCFVPGSSGMVFWVGFSKNIEGGFRDWCVEEMVKG